MPGGPHEKDKRLPRAAGLTRCDRQTKPGGWAGRQECPRDPQLLLTSPPHTHTVHTQSPPQPALGPAQRTDLQRRCGKPTGAPAERHQRVARDSSTFLGAGGARQGCRAEPAEPQEAATPPITPSFPHFTEEPAPARAEGWPFTPHHDHHLSERLRSARPLGAGCDTDAVLPPAPPLRAVPGPLPRHSRTSCWGRHPGKGDFRSLRLACIDQCPAGHCPEVTSAGPGGPTGRWRMGERGTKGTGRACPRPPPAGRGSRPSCRFSGPVLLLPHPMLSPDVRVRGLHHAPLRVAQITTHHTPILTPCRRQPSRSAHRPTERNSPAHGQLRLQDPGVAH